MTARHVAIVPHTHWDREWYEPFQSFRMRLVEMLDEALPRLASDPSYSRFLLDGQMVAVEDYLAIRPEAEETIRQLAASGRISVGPWYVLMDEFLVSGETLVRNLQMGLERAASFGGAMEIGYLPDMFGHVAQMPQLLRQVGFEHAVVWRGVPAAVDRTAFWWTAPDGSTVRAEYLVCGYGNGASIPDDAKALVRRIAHHEEEIGPFLVDGILFMNGTDHQWPQPWLGKVVAEANQIQDDYELSLCSLAEALSASPTTGLPGWAGELRSGARANLLMGVASNRVDVKQAAARTERALERHAEPLCALFLPPRKWPGALLDVAWREVVLNSAHDSICACSVDEVVSSVLDRFAQARQIAEGLAERALDSLGDSLAQPGITLVNTSAASRGGVVEMVVAGDQVPPGCQALPRPKRTLMENARLDLTVAEVRNILGMIREQQIGRDLFVNSIDIADAAGGLEVVIHADRKPRANVAVEEMKRDLYARLGTDPAMPVAIRFVHPKRRRVLARVEEVPGFGWKAWAPGPLDRPVTLESLPGTIRLDNGLVQVEVDGSDGTFALNGVAGMNRLVDSGDEGDTYNYSPPANDIVVDHPEEVVLEIVEKGPVRAQVRVNRTYRWPERLKRSERARSGSTAVLVTSLIELRAGETMVRVQTSFENHCRDHRLRAVFPLPQPATFSEAECAFAVVRRGLDAEGGPSERGLATFPSRRFVRAGGLSVLHDGLLEYELVEQSEANGQPIGARAVAITLVRATGMLSQIEMSYRPVPAGPDIALEGPQLQGPLRCRYAVSSAGTDPFRLAEDFLSPVVALQAEGGGSLPAEGSALSVTGAEVSAVRRRGELLELRMFNPTPEPVSVVLEGRSGWLVDLRGDPLEAFSGGFGLGPWAIATAHLSAD